MLNVPYTEHDASKFCYRWEFCTEDYDIGFGVMHFLNDNTAVPMEPVQRYNCHQVAHDGTLVCEQTGTCELSLYCLYFLYNNSYRISV